MSGGGGGGNYEAQQAEIERKKQRARDSLNVQFGTAPNGGSAPTRDEFTTVMPRIISSAGNGTVYSGDVSTFDQAGYDAALAEFNNLESDAAKNKVARDALYGKVRENAFTAGKRGLDERRSNAARELKFALFGQGLNGGSVDIDQNATLGRTYDTGVLNLGAKADASKADLQANDEQTRLGLLQSIDAGMDQGSALSSALNQLNVNNDRAAATAQGTDLGDLFGDAGLLYSRRQAAYGRQAAQDDFRSLYGTSSRPRVNRGSTGIITSTG